MSPERLHPRTRYCAATLLSNPIVTTRATGPRTIPDAPKKPGGCVGPYRAGFGFAAGSSANAFPTNSFSNVSDRADAAVLVDRDDDRHGRRLQDVDRVVQDRPVEPLPPGEQPAPFRVPLLGHAEDDQLTVLRELSGRVVPDRHVPAAAGSPRRELDQRHLLGAEVGQRDRLAVGDVREGEVRVPTAGAYPAAPASPSWPGSFGSYRSP